MSLIPTFPHLISGPSKLASISTTITTTELSLSGIISGSKDREEDRFPISHLPYELRQFIYINHICSSPPLLITSTNASLPHHKLTTLPLSSPFFTRDIPPSTYHHHTTFIFTCGAALKSFSEHYSRGKDVRRIKIVYGKDEFPTRDWVVLMGSCFGGLEEMTFELERERCGLNFGNWWGCVRDAVREGRREGIGNGRGLRLRVEDGEWGVCEVLR